MAAATNFLANMQPHPDTISKGAVQGGPYQLFPPNSSTPAAWLNLPFNGVPGADVGVGWAGRGSTGYDYTTGIWYSNIGTAAVPNWQKIGAQ